jgi:UDP-glucose 4-epimerase
MDGVTKRLTTTLVTGATGFVGSNVVRSLARAGHQVVGLDLVPPDPLVEDYLTPWKDRVTFVQADIRARPDLDQKLAGEVTKIVHAAVYTGFRPEEEAANGHAIVDINVLGTTTVLELARELGIERFAYVSSGSVYGPRREPDEVLAEDVPLNPATLYELTKHAGELLTRRYGQLHGFETVSLRLAGPYGPMERVTGHRAVQSLVKEWTGKLVRGEPIELRDRTERQKLIYVVDLADAIVAVLDAPELRHDVYNICLDGWTTVGELADSIAELMPATFVAPVDGSAAPHMDPALARMSPERLTADVRFEPRYDLVSGLREYLDWRVRASMTE